jgi:hypothetical protein
MSLSCLVLHCEWQLVRGSFPLQVVHWLLENYSNRIDFVLLGLILKLRDVTEGSIYKTNQKQIVSKYRR